jgi:hypothetical protein
VNDAANANLRKTGHARSPDIRRHDEDDDGTVYAEVVSDVDFIAGKVQISIGLHNKVSPLREIETSHRHTQTPNQ